MRGGTLYVPLIINNPLERGIEVNISVKAPDGWKAKPVELVSVEPHTRYTLKVEVAAPPEHPGVKAEAGTVPGAWQPFVISGKAGGEEIGTVAVRVNYGKWAAPQQELCLGFLSYIYLPHKHCRGLPTDTESC